jgi:eukaryotic-like serine/threonine-protein kinase
MKELREGDRLDQYLLTDILARTASATTFKGHDTQAGSPVCVKVPHLEYESDVVSHDRFTREIALGLRLDHPNIVRGQKPLTMSRLYLVTEYVDGKSLRVLMQSGRLPEAAAVDVACQILGALEYLHAHGVVHRDLKPENVLVTAAGQVKLIDFGIALDRATRRLTWTKLSRTFGTPDYMAPEQVAGKRGDERSDIYAAGVILYEMLAQALPFSAANGFGALQAKVREEPMPLSCHVSTPDPALDAIVTRAIERDARKRHQSATEMMTRLRQRDASDMGVDAPHEKRRPWIARLMVVFALAGLSSLVWLSRVDQGPPPGDPPVARSR